MERLYCCTLNHGNQWDQITEGEQCAKPPTGVDCATITAKANACDEVQMLSDADYQNRQFNKLAPGSVAEARFRDNTRVPADFESFLRKNPNYDLISPGSFQKPMPYNQDQYRRIVRYVMGSTNTKVLESW